MPILMFDLGTRSPSIRDKSKWGIFDLNCSSLVGRGTSLKFAFGVVCESVKSTNYSRGLMSIKSAKDTSFTTLLLTILLSRLLISTSTSCNLYITFSAFLICRSIPLQTLICSWVSLKSMVCVSTQTPATVWQLSSLTSIQVYWTQSLTLTQA